jgi:hypothetical protein
MSERIEKTKEFLTDLNRFVTEVLREGEDYGTFQGIPKYTLLLPGAHKVLLFLGATARTEVTCQFIDGTGLLAKAVVHLERDGQHLADGVGICTSRETRFQGGRRRRICPDCGRPAVIPQRPEYGTGYICLKSEGGCGKVFSTPPPINEADVYNNVIKLAKKRALVDAVLTAAPGISAMFTQDLEDTEVPAEDNNSTTDITTDVDIIDVEMVRTDDPVRQKIIRNQITPMRNYVGEDVFCEILGRMGYKSLDDVPTGELERVVQELKREAQAKAKAAASGGSRSTTF